MAWAAQGSKFADEVGTQKTASGPSGQWVTPDPEVTLKTVRQRI